VIILASFLGTHARTCSAEIEIAISFSLNLIPTWLRWRSIHFRTLPAHQLMFTTCPRKPPAHLTLATCPPIMPSHKRGAIDTNEANNAQPSKKPRRATFRVASKPKNKPTVSATTLRTHLSGHIGRHKLQVKSIKQVNEKESEEAGDNLEGGAHDMQASSSSGAADTLSTAQASPTLSDNASTKPKRRKRVNTTSVSHS